AGVEPGVAHFRDAPHRLVAARAADDDVVDPGTVQLAELVEALDGALAQLGQAANDREGAASAGVERERQAPVALARDGPVAHIGEPVVHALARRLRHPAHFGRLAAQARAHFLNGDEPLGGQAEDQLLAAAPADWIAVRVVVLLVDEALGAQVGEDERVRLADAVAAQLAEAGQVDAGLVDRLDDGQVLDAGQLEVLGATARRDVDHAGALFLADLFPRDDAVLDALLRLDLGERRHVVQADQVAALHGLDNLVVAAQDAGGVGREVVELAILADLHVVQVGMDGQRHVRGEGPGRRRPDEDALVGPLDQGEREVDGAMGEVTVGVGADELVLGEARAAAQAPGQRARALVEPAVIVAAAQEAPDRLDVLVGQRVIAIVPVHPLAEADGLLRDEVGVAIDALAAAVGEVGQAVGLDLALGVEAQLLLDLDLDP